MRVLVFDGDDDYRRTLSAHLMSAGMEVMAYGHGGTTLDEALHSGPCDAALFNVHLPVESGFSLAARLRLVSDAGLVLLTAAARREDRVLALSLGVDHYLVKPDDHHELEMVIRNLHRRLRGAARDLEPARPRQWMFDAARWSITTPTGAIVTLSLAEYTVIAALLARPGDAVSRDDLLTALDRRDVRVYSRNLDMIVSRLRRKVARAGVDGLPIQSARGIGYVFTGVAVMVGDAASS